MKYLVIPVLFFALCVVLAFNGFVDLVKGLAGKLRKKFVFVGVASVACLVLSTGCTKPQVAESLQIARMGSNVIELTQTWDGNRAALVKYRDMLTVEDPDYEKLENIIAQGDQASKLLVEMSDLSRIPTVFEVRLMFLDADSAVQDGVALYKEYEEQITPPDKFRAKLFSASWGDLRTDIAFLTKATSEPDRYWLSRDVFTTLLQVTAQVIIPTLQATGKI